MLSVVNSSKAQDIFYLSAKFIDPNSGLASSNVRKILQDKYGFMWIATQEGLSRFDGKNFINFTNANKKSQRILNSDVTDILTDSQGNNIWALTPYAGLTKIDIQTLQVVDSFGYQQLNINQKSLGTTKMYADKNYLFISSEEGYVLKFNISTKKVENWVNLISNENKSSKIEMLCATQRGLLVGFSGGRLITCNNNLTDIAKVNPESELLSEDLHFTDVKKDEHGNIILATNKGLHVLTPDLKEKKDSWLHKLLPGNFFKEEIFGEYFSASSNWIACAKGLYTFTDNATSLKKAVPAGDPQFIDWFSTASSIYKSGDNLWLGSQSGIALISNLKNPFTSYYTSYDNKWKLNHCVHLLLKNDSTLYSCATDGFYKVNLKTSIISKLSDNSLYVYSCKLPGNNLMVSGISGTFCIVNDKLISISKLFPELALIDKDEIVASENINDSLIFLTSQFEKGIYIWNVRKKQVERLNINTAPIRLTSNIINRLYLENNQKLWILCDNLISIYDIQKKEITDINLTNPVTGLSLNIIMDICQTKNNYWLAVYGMGIIKLKKDLTIDSVFADNSKFKSLGLYKIVSVNDTLIVASSNIGLITFNTNTNNIKSFYKADGLHSDNFEEFSADTFGDKIYMGGVNGFTQINSSELKTNSSPPSLYFSTLVIQRKKDQIEVFDLNPQKITVPNDYLQLRINYTTINYSNPERVTFKYKIQELNKSWVAHQSQSFIDLMGLYPGTYHLQIQAFNEDGVPSEIKELTLIFLPKWYQTWWFRALLSLIIIAIGYGLYRLRINQLKKEEKIRRALASDLHDDLGSTLNSVKVYTNLALMEKENKNHLQKIKESSQEAIAGVRDLIWVLDDKKDTPADLLARIQQFAIPLCEANHISFVSIIDPSSSLYKLRKEEKRNLYMIIKESINNSIKYAGCKKIDLNMSVAQKKLMITITDDGIGFAMNEIKEGNGLKNIRNRSKEIRYEVKIVSDEGKGTHITLYKS